MNTALKWFIRIWVGFGILLNVAAIGGILVSSPTIGQAWSKFWEIYSPFNLINYLAELILFLPAIGAAAWLDRRTGVR